MATFPFKEITLLILSYLLGSFPSGYLFSKFFSNKNPLEVGWKKTSASNVFFHVGKKIGILTAACDILKGTLAVFLAKKFGSSLFFQAICGLLAVFGHNWSLFLRFSGGRGLGTFIGAGVFLFPQVFFFPFFLLLILAFIWNTSIGTIFFLKTLIIFSFKFSTFPLEAGFFTTIGSILIFLKRLSPIKESFSNERVFLSRLIFDDNLPKFEMRSIKILKKLTKSSN